MDIVVVLTLMTTIAGNLKTVDNLLDALYHFYANDRSSDAMAPCPTLFGSHKGSGPSATETQLLPGGVASVEVLKFTPLLTITNISP